MGWRFRKRIKILPGINLNIGNSGMSVNVGVKGASVTFGPKGTYVNTGVPGTGLYRRDLVSESVADENSNIQPDFTTNSQCDNVSGENPNEGKHGIWYYIKRLFSKSDASNIVDSEGTLQDTNEEAIAKEDVKSNTIDLTDEDVSNVATPSAKAGDDPEFTVVEGFKEEDATGTSLTMDEILSAPINPREPYSKYTFPGLDLLKKYEDNQDYTTKEELLANKKRIIEVLNSFGIQIREITATVGPTITLYEIILAEGVRVSKLRGLEDDIALALYSHDVKFLIPVPGRGTIGIEVPNVYPSIVGIESIFNTRRYQTAWLQELPLAIGMTVTNDVFMIDLAKLPHLLIAGATGQGKSVCLNTMICSLLFKKHPNELKIVLMSPYGAEFSLYSPIASAFMAQIPDFDEEPIVTDVTKAVRTLNALCTLMNHRYDLLKMAGARNVKEYNERFVNHRLRTMDSNGNPLHEYMPYIVVIIDEYGDFIEADDQDFETSIIQLAQNARAVGIHLVISTKRPTNDVITGAIKANIPARIAFRLPERIDSRVILDCDGAEELLGNGDMLFRDGKSIDCVRIQGAYVDTSEIKAVAWHIHSQEMAGLTPQYPMDIPEPMVEGDDGGAVDTGSWDPIFVQAAHAIVNTQIGSTSMIQRQFSIGYNRAGRLMDQLEKAGVVGPAHGSKPREVLFVDEQALDNRIAALRGGTR